MIVGINLTVIMMKIIFAMNAVCVKNVVLNVLNNIAGSQVMLCRNITVVMAIRSTIETITCRNQTETNNGIKLTMTIF